MTARDIVMGAAGNSGDSKTYIEDVFSTYLYAGNGSTQTINNGIDLAGQGGMVWIKSRSNANSNFVVDTARGNQNPLFTNLTDGQASGISTAVTSFNSTGFSLGVDNQLDMVNVNARTYASWTFRKAPKFFDVVTWTGNGGRQNIAHNLGSTPGMIIVKRTDSTSNWVVYHKGIYDSFGNFNRVCFLNNTDASFVNSRPFGLVEPNATQFQVEDTGSANTTNVSGGIYVAYLFGHDTTTDGLIQCGSLTAPSSGNVTSVNLGYEPQWILLKVASQTGDWIIVDTLRGMSYSQTSALRPNTTAAEQNLTSGYVIPTATGFNLNFDFFAAGATIIYMAIRRGPMRTPTDATKVFDVDAYTGDAVTSRKLTVGFPTDASLIRARAITTNFSLADVLRGLSTRLYTDSTQAEAFNAAIRDNTTYQLSDGTTRTQNSFDITYISYFFQRAPGFFDVVCYTGTGVARTVNHNLGVAPELVIVKKRNGTGNWFVGAEDFTYFLPLNFNYDKQTTSAAWNNTVPTASVFTAGTATSESGSTYVAYLFASCPGVSKVGTYTGTGATLNVDCGFTNGARFVLIKNTGNQGGSWNVFDTARGITSGSDPMLSLNSTGAEYSGANLIDPYSPGFTVKATGSDFNFAGQVYLYLAIA